MYAHPDVCIDWGLTSLTLGTNTKHSVVVEQNMMNIDIMTKAASCCSRSTNDRAAPITHMITTLYTLIPIYLESLSAGMLTCRVSHARKQPKAYKRKKKLQNQNIYCIKKFTMWLYRVILNTIIATKLGHFIVIFNVKYILLLFLWH